ncbi:MAG: hypothetical protein Q9165_007343 [Trypethelium subeluteriae]
MDRRHSLWNAQPRRQRTNKLIDIFEDEREQRSNAIEKTQLPPTNLGKNDTVEKYIGDPTISKDSIHPATLCRKPRRSSILGHNPPRDQDDRTETIDFGTKEKQCISGVKKPPRRRTIYIPSEDTSILTIHPGAPSHKRIHGASPTQNTVLFALAEDQEQEHASPSQIASARQKFSRKSLALAPRRIPLQCARNPTQPKSVCVDIAGKKTGKENVPPNQPKLFEDVIKIPDDKEDLCSEAVEATKDDRHMSITAKPRRVSLASRVLVNERSEKRPSPRAPLEDSRSQRVKRQAQTSRARGDMLSGDISGGGLADKTPLSSSSVSGRPLPRCRRSSNFPTQLVLSESVGKKSRQPASLYPILSEEIKRPELYEDQWLHHQEIAISQVINGIFDSCQGNVRAEMYTEVSRRKAFLSLYSDVSFSLLHQRLQASLLYGALSISKEAMSRAGCVKDDVGLKRKFLNVWLDTYDTRSLKAAAEVVIGREAPSLSDSSSCPGKHADRKLIEDFLDTFLLRNLDVPNSECLPSVEGIDIGSVAWSWRRTATRSLLLILLLDKAKCSGEISDCLFKKTSERKTSAAVLKSVAKLIFPSLGDVSRPLVHLDFQVQHEQYPLQELEYRIRNLAVDLRDGRILTRLVELLLHPSGDLPIQSDGTVTLAVPTGELLTSTASSAASPEPFWILSQHLKYPCIGRAQKLFNAQIAISALSAVKSMPEQILQDVRAEDIVDGHREKTLRLLWILVGRWGLESLIDWNAMTDELRHFRTQWHQAHPEAEENWDSDSDIDSTDTNTSQRHKALLKAWAASIGRLHNIRINNLSTSFSNGHAFAAIVNEYWQFFPNSSSTTTTTTTTITTITDKASSPSIYSKLRRLGCSAAFANLIPKSGSNTKTTTAPTRILTSATTLPALAFLASRLLPLARTHRAACTLQRAYRLRLARRTVSRRLVCLRLAHHCAAIVQTQVRVVWAAVVLQRGWRVVLRGRVERLMGDVVGVQTLVRGWMVRRGLRRKGVGKGRERERRGVVAVGW